MGGEVPHLYVEQSRLLQEAQDKPEWKTHYENAQKLIGEAISLVPHKEQVLVVGHGFGRELPQRILEFDKLTINDIDPQVLKSSVKEYTQKGAKAEQVETVPADITGIVDHIKTTIDTLPSDINGSQLLMALRRLREESRQVELTVNPADLTISALVLPHTWREPMLLLRQKLQEKFGPKFDSIVNAMENDLRGKLFDEHLQFLKRHTKDDGAIVLITQISKNIPGEEVEVLPPGAEDVIRGLAARSQKRFGKQSLEWTWNYDTNQSYKVLGVLLDPKEIPQFTTSKF